MNKQWRSTNNVITFRSYPNHDVDEKIDWEKNSKYNPIIHLFILYSIYCCLFCYKKKNDLNKRLLKKNDIFIRIFVKAYLLILFLNKDIYQII